MIINETTITYSEQYLHSRGISPENSAFFDIETTGFKAGYSHLYLIGVAFRCPSALDKADVSVLPSKDSNVSNSTWTIRQWMAERPQEETQLLKTFAEFLKSFTTILHFNGKRFDIPYLEEKYAQYQLSSPFLGLISVDLYQDFRCLKSFLKLEHMNQKSLEVFLGLERDDKYDGGKLIPVYRDFCKTNCDDKLHLLLLHNQEDVSGMFTLTTLYGYLDFFKLAQTAFPDGIFSSHAPLGGAPSTGASPDNVSSASLSPQIGRLTVELMENNDGTQNVLLTFPLTTPVPVPISHALELGYLTLKNSTGKLLLPMLKDTLYYFFPDYKNYYYLPQEDQAIHKSVAAYVEKQYRQPAKKENCYIKQYGTFLPQAEELFSPVFRRNDKDNTLWFLWKEEEWNDASKWNKYLASLIKEIGFITAVFSCKK